MSNWKASDLVGKKGIRSVKGAEIPRPESVLSEIATGIFIPGDVISSKNNWGVVYRQGKPAIGYKEVVLKYKASTIPDYTKYAMQFREMTRSLPKPFYCALKFLRKTNGRFDANNMTQMVADLMVETGWIDDDDDKTIRFIPMNTVYRSPTPGVIIFV